MTSLGSFQIPEVLVVSTVTCNVNNNDTLLSSYSKPHSTDKNDASPNEMIIGADRSESSANNLMDWIVPSTSVNQRMRRIEEILDSIPYFFSSMLDDNNLQRRLLVELGDCFLVSSPKLKREINPESNWYLVILEQNEILKVKVSYRDKTLKIWNGKSATLRQYIQMRSLKTIERPWKIIPEQLTKKMSTIPQHAFPIDDSIFPLGTLSRKTFNFDNKRWIPVIEMNITDCSTDDLKCLIAEAEKRRRFGTIRIWRLWGICEYGPRNVSLVLEDIVYGSVAGFVRTSLRPQEQQCKFAVQIVDGLRSLEKYGFIHCRLSIDVCLLTYNYNVKIAIYGLTAGELYPTYVDLDDVDQCRWLPPECLPSSGDTPAPYNASGMIYSLGVILWSMFHGGALPFEDEPAANIRNRQYRIQNPLYIEPELVPSEIRNVILSCCSEDISLRGRLKSIKIYLRNYFAPLI
uniref:Protein kinase domain-containing protein n=1 Tax=Elaeophora elaphi TaxID=1147741 RepID=A0A158Q8H0_9BILA